MGTLSIGRTGAGLALLIAFTIGLHLTILFIGFLLVLSKQFAARRTSIRFIYTLPIISSVAITLLGVYLLLRNLAIIG
jgi:ABC-type nickel/cobalt efflux system permease component RcnA